MRWIVSLVMSVGLCALHGKEPMLSCEKKIGEIKWEGITFHRYRLRAEHFPSDQTFCLVVQSFDGTATETFKYQANPKGHLILIPPEGQEGDLYAVCPAKRGERLTFVMQGQETGYKTDLIPFPLAMRSKKGIDLNLELQGQRGEKFFLFAQGFQPEEKISCAIQVGERLLPQWAEVTVLGDLCMLIDLTGQLEWGEAKLV